MNILIYGTGGAAKNFFYKSIDLKKAKLLAFVDRSVREDSKVIGGYNVITREQIGNYQYDFIIIASTFTEIYTTLIEEYKISEYKLIPVYYYGKHHLIEKIILNEITKQNNNLALLEVKKSNDIVHQKIDMICLEDIYFRDKIICKVCRLLQSSIIDDVYIIGKPNSLIAKLIIMIINKPIYILHSIEDSFQMSVSSNEQIENLMIWEKMLENEMKYSSKSVLEQFDNKDYIKYRFGSLLDILNQCSNKISLAYIETSSIKTLRSILNNIYEKINFGGYVYLYNPILTQEGCVNSQEIYKFIKSKYDHFIQIPLISDDIGILWYKAKEK